MHAYLIVTNQKVDVREFVKGVNEPIIEHFFTKIKIDDVRELNGFLQTKGVESHVIYFDNFLDVAQNAFLKTLEEPGGDKQIFLISKSRSTLLDTLISRLTVFEVQQKEDQQIGQKFLKQNINERLETIKKILDAEHDDVRPQAQKLIANILNSPGLNASQKKTLAEMYENLFAQGSSAKQVLEFIAVTV